jgi:hypothetical protein
MIRFFLVMLQMDKAHLHERLQERSWRIRSVYYFERWQNRHSGWPAGRVSITIVLDQEIRGTSWWSELKLVAKHNLGIRSCGNQTVRSDDMYLPLSFTATDARRHRILAYSRMVGLTSSLASYVRSQKILCHTNQTKLTTQSNQNTVELCYNIMKGTEYFASL